jgi:hypothetical protein
MDIQEVVEFMIRKGAEWVRTQREQHRPDAQPLTEKEQQNLAGYFAPATLDAARVKSVPVIPAPEFYDQLAALGFQNPLDFTQMAAITFADTILISARHPPPDTSRDALLFHELVHVVQYEALGVEEFVRRYVRGWAQNGFRYEGIQLERDAYDLQGRYEAQPRRPFAVRAEVRRRLGLS